MTDQICFLCGETHPWNECPKMEARAPAPPFPMDLPGPPAPVTPLPPTQFEQLYGRGAEELLQDVTDGDPEDWSNEQRELALRILSGITSISTANNEERRVLDDIARKMAFSKTPAQKAQAKLQEAQSRLRDVRPPHIRSQEEMEHFPEEYQPPPAERDWPISPDHPEGKQG